MDTQVRIPARGSWTAPLIGLAAGALAFALIYLPDIGHGFIRDDFMWIRVGRIASARDVVRLLTSDTGFYRPLVSASFGASYALAGLNPFPYALTNLALFVVCAALIMRVARALELSPSAAVAAALVWAFNFHAVSMALLWLSGRTALLLCLFGLLTMLSTMSGRRWWAAACCLLALLSKEEAVAFPFVMGAWTWHATEGSIRSRAGMAVTQTWPMLIALAVYMALRLNSGAFGPGNAPSYYRFSASVPLLLRNAAEYADRACTLSAAVVLVVMAAVRRRPALLPIEKRAVALGAMWLVAGFSLTIFLPVRSDLYALNPSIGAALVAGAAIHALERSAAVATRRAVAVLLVLPFLLLPVYRLRNRRWVAPADTSADVAAGLARETARLPDGTRLVLVDAAGDTRSVKNAFGDLLPDAMTLLVGRGITADIVAPADAERSGSPAATPHVLLRFTGERLERIVTPVH